MRRQHGDHTWDLSLHYYRCPECGFIIEDRQAYLYRMGRYEKEVVCPRCGHSFISKKPLSTIGPIFGTPQPVEMDWSE
jgi:uncharacterized C2H2 Zn-finger protein